MSHHIYQTEGIVLSGANFGEANRYIQVFTKDLGLIMCSVQGIRLLKSKLRYSLQDFSHCTLSLVKGKNIWKITNAAAISSFRELFCEDKKKFEVCARVLALLRRMLAGEEKNEALFSMVRDAFQHLRLWISADSDIKNFECVLVLRILHDLGYLGTEVNLSQFTQNAEWNEGLLRELENVRREALYVINTSLKESHL